MVYLKGVDENYRYTTGVADHIVNGQYDLGSEATPKPLLGGVENALGIVADRNIFTLKVYLPRKAVLSRSICLKISAVIRYVPPPHLWFSRTSIINMGSPILDFIKRALKLEADQYSGIEIATSKDPGELGWWNQPLKKNLYETYLVQKKYEQNQSLYSVMNMERWAIYGISLPDNDSSFFQYDWRSYHAGTGKRKHQYPMHWEAAGSLFSRVFLSEGLLLALIGGGIGMLLALLIAWLQTHFILYRWEVLFLINHIPVKLRLIDFLF